MFANVSTPQQVLDLMKGQRFASGDIPTEEQALKMQEAIPVDEQYFDAVKKYTGMEFKHAGDDKGNTWEFQGYEPQQTTPKLSDKQFTPGFKYEEGKLYQKRQGRVTGEEHWETSNPLMASMYAKKYGTGEMSRSDLQKQIQDNPEAFASSWGQQAEKDAQLASLSLKKYGGDAGGKKKVRVKLPSYDVGGVATSNRPTRWQNVPKNETRWDITKPGFDETKVRKGHYIKKADGKWYKATGKTPRELPTYKGENLERTFSNDQAVANKYAFLEQTFNDRDIKEEFAAKVKEALKNEANYKDKTGKSVSMDKRMTEEEINALTPDDIVQSHLNMQRRNYAFVAKGIDPKDFSDSNGELKTNLSAEKKKKYKDLGITNISTAADVVGVPLGEQGADSKIGLEQASYIGFNDLLKNRENYSSELQDKLKPFKQAKQWGSKDEPLGTISPIDRWYTDTSAGQLDLIDDEGDMGFEEAEWKEAAATDTKHLADPTYPGKTPFWTQDLVNFGQAVMNRYNIPRFEPYEAKAQVRLPRATFMDPMQQVQNILGSQSNVLDAASTYATPGGFAATAGLLHGQSANAAANAIANVHNQNVGIANQFERWRNAILNRASERDAQLATRLHDKYNILNQQLANSKMSYMINIM
jgi:hypothetical protein